MFKFDPLLNKLKITESYTEALQLSISDTITPITVGVSSNLFRLPYGLELSDVRLSLGTAQTSGSIFTVDVKQNGVSILSTKLTIDNTEKTSVTATTPAVISTTTLIDDAEMTFHFDQVGDGTAIYAILTLIGTRI
jgi:hypothetical protein